MIDFIQSVFFGVFKRILWSSVMLIYAVYALIDPDGAYECLSKGVGKLEDYNDERRED